MGIAAAIVVALVLLLAGVLTGLGGSGGSSGALTYSKAEPIAGQAVANYSSETWVPLVAEGIDVQVGMALPINLSATSPVNCTLIPSSGVPGTLAIPAYSGNRSAGAAPLWLFLFRDASEGVVAAVVNNGQGSVFGTLAGSCVHAFALLSPLPPNVIDSSRAGAVVAPEAAPFLAAHPNASASYTLVGGVTLLGASIGPEWEIEFTTCPLYSSVAESGLLFNATVNALSGHLVYSQSNLSVTCPSSASASSPPPIGTAFALGPATPSHIGALFDYRVSVEAVAAGITWSELNAVVQNATSGTDLGAWTLSADGPTGTALATYVPATNGGSGTWTGSAQTPIVAGDSFDVQSNASLAGDPFLLSTPGGQYSGTVSVTL